MSSQKLYNKATISKDEQCTTIIGYRRQPNDSTEDKKMGKRDIKKAFEDTRVLFKKSNQMLVQSRTCSESSEFYTKCGILQFKRELSQCQNLNCNDATIKRDLSIETDICILRRYCRKKMNRLSTNGSGKSKYSTLVSTEIGTIEEYQADTSACGDCDSENADLPNNLILDTTRIMMDNLKELLNDWLVKNLLAKPDTKTKLENALYSLLHKCNNYDNEDTNESSSRRTYILNRHSLSQEVKNKKVATTSSYCIQKKNKLAKKKAAGTKLKSNYKNSLCHSTPGLHHVARRIISTLSIPRHMNKQPAHKIKNNFKVAKSLKKQNLLLSIDKLSKVVDNSSYDLLTISTKSFTKRCATLDCENIRTLKKNRQIVFQPDALHKIATDSSFECNNDTTSIVTDVIRKETLQSMPSLMKSLYAGDPANITSTDYINNCMNDNGTMTEHITLQHPPLNLPYISNVIDQTVDISERNKCPVHKNVFSKTGKPNSTKKTVHSAGIKEIENIKNISINSCITSKSIYDDNLKSNINDYKKKTKFKPQNRVTKSYTNKKKSCFLYTSPKRKKRPITLKNDAQQFGDYCYNIFKLFTERENKNMQFNIEIKIVPKPQIKNEDKSTTTSVQNVNSIYTVKNAEIVCNMEAVPTNKLNENVLEKSLILTTEHFGAKTDNIHVIIPLLDGSISQDKYLTRNTSSAIQCVDLNALTVDRSTITDDEIIKDINELKVIIKDLTKAAQSFVREQIKEDPNVDEANKVQSKSRAVQFPNDHPVAPGNKLSKGTTSHCQRKNVSEFYNRVMQKSNSYNIIESESIIRVTDMTSGANCYRKQSYSSLVKSMSLLAMASDNRSKYFTYYCDECKRGDDLIRVVPSEAYFPSHGNSDRHSWSHVYSEPTELPLYMESNERSQMFSSEICECQNRSGGGEDSVEKVSMNVCDNSIDDNKIFRMEGEEIKKIENLTPVYRRGMGFFEGFLYCLLISIPVCILFFAFCKAVLKHKIELNKPKAPFPSYNSTFSAKLSDFGF